MSPWGAVEMPLRYVVPTMGSAPRSSSKLTSSKLPVHEEDMFIYTQTLWEWDRVRQSETERDRVRQRDGWEWGERWIISSACRPLFVFIFQAPQDRGACEAVTQPMSLLTVRCCYQLLSVGQEGGGGHVVCLYLQQQPAAVGSLCNSPSRPAGIPPRSLWHPAAAAEVGRGHRGAWWEREREGGMGRRGEEEEERRKSQSANAPVWSQVGKFELLLSDAGVNEEIYR